MILDIIVYNDVTVYDLLIVLITLSVSILAAKAISINLRRGLKERVSKDHLENINKFVTYGIFIAAIIWTLPSLGLDPSGLLVAGGIVGVVIGFASQSTVGNLVSGILLMFERPVKIGDKVDIDGNRGYVEDIQILSTRIRTFDGLYVRIPNEKVFTNNITNYVGNAVRRFEYVIGVRYSDDANKVIEIIKKLIDNHPLALKRPHPTVFVDNLGDNSVNIIARIWGTPNEWYDVKMDLLWKIKKTLEDEGIEIAFPQRTVWFAKEPAKKTAKTEEVQIRTDKEAEIPVEGSNLPS